MLSTLVLAALALQDSIQILARDAKNLDKVKALLEKDPGLVHARDDLDTQPLHDAARFASLDMVKLLVEKGADVNAVCYNRFRPLYFAASSGKLDVVKYFIEKKAELDTRDAFDSTPLREAARRGHRDVVKALRDAGATYDITSAVSLRDSASVRAMVAGDEGLAKTRFLIHEACGVGDAGIVRFLIEKGADPNDRPATGFRGPAAPPMSLALEHPDVVKVLLEKGVDPKGGDDDFRFPSTFLHTASRLGYVDTVRLLLDAGAPVDMKWHDVTPLIAAAGEGRTRVVELLLERKAAVHADALEAAASAMRPFAKGENAEANSRLYETAQVLRKRGLKPGLFAAIALGDLDVVKAILKERPAAHRDQGVENETPLARATTLSRTEIVAALLDAGAEINARGRYGATALQWAAFWGLPHMVKVLLERGADVNAQGERGSTALSEALRVHPHAADVAPYDEVIRLLKVAGAK